ncbi:hypothetical protein F4780DRAFT_732835 [Xylariomycetidae sp. FL0641]|nr:hypothetical protein F4780DRAFT_732835 [Xylariomycetidae sp. FL0641]
MAILEFFRRLTVITWKRSHEITLTLIRCTLVATFVAIVISDLAECQPFNHYWQVMPDPGGQCRQGYVQLVTSATGNILTDLLLVCFPVPIILTSHMGPKKKFQLTLLFSMSLGPVACTAYRVTHVLWQDGNQQTRSLLASVELLFATAAANTLVLGSFVRDRGTKKRRYKHGSIATDSLDRGSIRGLTLHRHWGSDENLVRELGLGVDRELRGESEATRRFSPAPVADLGNWQFPQRSYSTSGRSDDSLLGRHPLQSPSRSNSTMTPRRVSFFDVGGLLDSDTTQSGRDSLTSSQDPPSPYSAPSPTFPASTSGFRRGSQTILNDLGGLLHSFNSRQSRSSPKLGTELQPIPQHPREPAYGPHDDRSTPVLVDVGGLLK